MPSNFNPLHTLEQNFFKIHYNESIRLTYIGLHVSHDVCSLEILRQNILFLKHVSDFNVKWVVEWLHVNEMFNFVEYETFGIALFQ
jgi:hypothetical protein